MPAEKQQVLPWRDRLGQDLHHAKLIEQADRPALVLGAQQNTGRAVVSRVQGIFSRDASSISSLLRFLPA